MSYKRDSVILHMRRANELVQGVPCNPKALAAGVYMCGQSPASQLGAQVFANRFEFRRRTDAARFIGESIEAQYPLTAVKCSTARGEMLTLWAICNLH